VVIPPVPGGKIYQTGPSRQASRSEGAAPSQHSRMTGATPCARGLTGTFTA